MHIQSCCRFLYGGQGIGVWDKLDVTPFSNASSVFDPVFWFPDVNISQVALDVKDMAELPARLRAIPAAEVRCMQAHLAEAQPFFRYRCAQQIHVSLPCKICQALQEPQGCNDAAVGHLTSGT